MSSVGPQSWLVHRAGVENDTTTGLVPMTSARLTAWRPHAGDRVQIGSTSIGAASVGDAERGAAAPTSSTLAAALTATGDTPTWSPTLAHTYHGVASGPGTSNDVSTT